MGFRVLLVFGIAVIGFVVGCAGPSSDPGSGPPSSVDSVPRRLPEPLPPPAEPAVAPAVTTPPVGSIVKVGAAPEGIVADPLTRTVAVGVRQPNELVLLNADSGAVTGRVPLPGVLRHLQLAAPGGPVPP